jgi:hypothetical protein
MSFLPSLSPGNVVDRYLPSDAEFDSNYKWTRPTESVGLGSGFIWRCTNK